MTSLRAVRVTAALAGILVVALIIGAAWWINHHGDIERAEDKRQANERIDKLEAERAEDRETIDALAGRLEDYGEQVTVHQTGEGEEVILIEGDPGKRGRPGRDGTDGAPGADSTVPGPQGRGIASMSCNEDGKWVIHYTEGDPQTVDNSSCTTAEPSPDEPDDG